MSADKRGKHSFGGPASKKGRVEDFDDIPGSFEEELALFEVIESESEPSQQSQKYDSQESVAGISDIVAQNKNRWCRPAPPTIDPSKDSLVFQQFEIENYVGEILFMVLRK